MNTTLVLTGGGMILAWVLVMAWLVYRQERRDRKS